MVFRNHHDYIFSFGRRGPEEAVLQHSVIRPDSAEISYSDVAIVITVRISRGSHIKVGLSLM